MRNIYLAFPLLFVLFLTGCPPNTVLSISPANRSVEASAGSVTFDVSNIGEGNMHWTAAVTDGSDWLSIENGNSGTNSGAITATFSNNLGNESRTGILTVTAPGAEGSPITLSVTQDWEPMAVVDSFTVENDAASTISRMVMLNNSCSGDPTEFAVNESGDFSSATWLPYSATAAYLLSSGNGAKQVYLKVRNTVWESDAVMASIELDAPAPLGIFHFDGNTDDSSGNGLTFNLDSNGSLVDNALYVNGVYNWDAINTGTYVTDLNYERLGVSLDVNLEENWSSGSHYGPIIQGGRDYRWFSIYIEYGTLCVRFNNASYSHPTSKVLNMGHWYNVEVGYRLDMGYFVIKLDGQLVDSCPFPEGFQLEVVTEQADNDKGIIFEDFSNGWAAKETVDNLTIENL